MKLLRFASEGGPRLGVLLGDHEVVPLDELQAPYPTIRSVIEGGSIALAAVEDRVRQARTKLPLNTLELLAPIERPGKYLAIGMNYQRHLEEALRLGVQKPTHQVWFNKQTTCLAGPYDAIDPGVSEQLD